MTKTALAAECRRDTGSCTVAGLSQLLKPGGPGSTAWARTVRRVLGVPIPPQAEEEGEAEILAAKEDLEWIAKLRPAKLRKVARMIRGEREEIEQEMSSSSPPAETTSHDVQPGGTITKK